MHIAVTRPLTSYSKVQAGISRIIRNRRLFAPQPGAGAYLNIGCGPYPRDGFFNIDWGWRPGINLCWDVTKRLPIESASCAGLFSEHCIEHIAFEDFWKLAREFHRVLMPGALVRIVVPDGELYVRRFLSGEPLPYADDDASGGIYTPFMSVNRIFYRHGHQFIYDFETMAAVLRSAGFGDIRRCSFATGSDKRLLIDQPERAVESLYVEAQR